MSIKGSYGTPGNEDRPRLQKGGPERAPGGLPNASPVGKNPKPYSNATTAARSSIRCAARIGVVPATGPASVQPGTARPALA